MAAVGVGPPDPAAVPAPASGTTGWAIPFAPSLGDGTLPASYMITELCGETERKDGEKLSDE